MYLTETHIIKKENPLYKEADYLCFLSKNLYNATLYEVRQHYFKTKEYLNYKKVNDLFTHNNQKDYRALPAKVSRGTQKQVEYDMKSFFASLKKKTKRKARIPHYADSLKGRKPLHYPKDALSFRKIPGYVCLSKTNIAVKSRIPAEKIEYVNIIPCAGYIMICIGYKKDCLKSFSGKGGYASIDLGLNNLASVCSDKFSPFIVNGKPLKSINQYYNKKKAEYQSLLPKNRKTSHRIDCLSLKRKNKIKDYLHKASSYLVNQLVSKGVSLLVLGYSKEWKQDISIGHRNNQNFVSIPFYRFKQMLIYKCALKGILFAEQEESYTSKCSFLDNEDICKHESYQGKRIKRGLFKAKNNALINADINGSLNIMKKYLLSHEAWNEKIFSDLVEGCSNPSIQKISF